MVQGPKIEKIVVNEQNAFIWMINLAVLIMFTAKIFKVNDLNWWVIFSPYIVGMAFGFLVILFNSFRRKPANNEIEKIIKGQSK